MTFLRPKRLEKKHSDAREPSLYRSICTSIISTLLSLVMLVGTTFAWFTDSITSNVFTITAGDFPAETYYWVGSNEPEFFSSGKIYSEEVGTGWKNVKEYADIFNGMQFNSENSSQFSQTVYLALVNNSAQNAATYRFYFESVAEGNSVGSNNIKDVLSFTCTSVETQENGGNNEWVSKEGETTTKRLSEFTKISEDGTAIQNPFVVEVEKESTKYVALTVGVADDASEEVAPSTIQLRLQIDITSGGDPETALTTVRETMRRPTDGDVYSIANDTTPAGVVDDSGSADTSNGAADVSDSPVDTAAVEPSAADDTPAADPAA